MSIKYTYQKIKEENLKINDRFIECIKYQGRVNDEELTHDIWLSKKSYPSKNHYAHAYWAGC